jgi:chemotaxis protein CheD
LQKPLDPMGTVRMGEIQISKRTGEELVARGLGSCIGLALIDRMSGVAGMAHIVLPESSGADPEPGKFADLAVPALIAGVQEAGAVTRRLDAFLAGGARMFELGEMDIGARNAAAVKAQLARAGIRVKAAETGGNRGRTMRLTVGEFHVTVKEAGGEPATLFNAGGSAQPAAAPRPGSATSRPGSATSRPGSATSRTTPATSRTASAASRTGLSRIGAR